jgi:hypothetical protein
MAEGRAGAWSCCHAPPVVYLVTHATNSLPRPAHLLSRRNHHSIFDFRILAGRDGAVAHLRPGMIERLRTVHDKVGASAVLALGSLFGGLALDIAIQINQRLDQLLLRL